MKTLISTRSTSLSRGTRVFVTPGARLAPGGCIGPAGGKAIVLGLATPSLAVVVVELHGVALAEIKNLRKVTE
jgi:hypothetical protein